MTMLTRRIIICLTCIHLGNVMNKLAFFAYIGSGNSKWCLLEEESLRAVMSMEKLLDLIITGSL